MKKLKKGFILFVSVLLLSVGLSTEISADSADSERGNYGYYRADETNNAVTYGVLLK